MIYSTRTILVSAIVCIWAAFAATAAAEPLGSISRFPAGTGSIAYAITAGPDGNLWFTDIGNTKAIGRVTTAGAITEFSSGLHQGSFPTASFPDDITAGPDGNLWFADGSNGNPAVGRITPTGTITEFTAGLNPQSGPLAITAGQDGNLWFADGGGTKAIGRITPSGTITEFAAAIDPFDVAAGPDGNVWFTDLNGAIGRITPTGTISEFSTGLNPGSEPVAITAGPDGNLWFTDQGTTKAIGRITPTGSITEFSPGLNPGTSPASIAAGTDGHLYVTDGGTPRAIARISVTGAIDEVTTGLSQGDFPGSDVAGPDGNLWLVDGGVVARAGPPIPPSVAPPSNLFILGGLHRHPHRGTATLDVRVFSPGRLTVSGHGLVHQRARAARVDPSIMRAVSGPGVFQLQIRAKGKKKRQLKHTGTAHLLARVIFRPTGGTSSFQLRPITLIKR